MGPGSDSPSVRELIAEYADLEDRMRCAEARAYGSSSVQGGIRELARLIDRERQILALLRRHRPESDPGTEALELVG